MQSVETPQMLGIYVNDTKRISNFVLPLLG